MKILIDNGHGIDTPGKRSPDGVLREYAWNRLIAGRVVSALTDLGHDAALLVPETEDLPLRAEGDTSLTTGVRTGQTSSRENGFSSEVTDFPTGHLS